MGLLGGSEVLVASTVYNMAGDVAGRPDYLKSLVAGNVIANSNFSMGETLASGYMNGPGIKARKFFRWALRAGNYDQEGLPPLQLSSHQSWDYDQIQAQIPVATGQTAKIQEVNYGPPDTKWWALQYILDHYAARAVMQWSADYDPDTATVTMNFPTIPATDSFVVTPAIALGQYFYVMYTLVEEGTGTLGSKLWIYKVGGDNFVMNGLPRTVTLNSNDDYCLPSIPIRLNNKFVSETDYPDLFEQTKKAYKKYTGQSLNKLIDKIKDNANIDDIDHIYMMPAVALNTPDNLGRKYLYRFFSNCITFFSVNGFVPNDDFSWDNWYTAWEDNYSTYSYEFTLNRNNWQELAAQPDPDPTADTDPGDYTNDPAYSGEVPKFVSAGAATITIEAPGPANDPNRPKLSMTIGWSTIKEITGTGLFKPDAVVGDLWWEIGTPESIANGQIILPGTMFEYQRDSAEVVNLIWQVDANNWKMLKFRNLAHWNKIYKQKHVFIKAAEAINSADESGFLVPIHYGTFRDVSLVTSTQMILSANYLVFNSYDIVKQKWYQTSLFKILVVVVIVAISVATGGLGAAGAGILGTNLAVGATLGLTGIAAAIVGAIANAIAGMIITKLITAGAVAAFGPKIGAIVAVIASVIAMQVGSALMSGQSMATVWGNLMTAQNILGMTSAVGNGVAGYVQAGAQQWAGKTQDLMDDYNAESKELTERYLKEFGGAFLFDPTALTASNSYSTETLDQFVGRTLMTGMDIAEMTVDMLNEFSSLTLDLNSIIGG